MATDQLKLYNGALLLCGHSRLATVDEPVDARYELDAAWDNDAARTCLQAGQWNFAIRSVQLPYTGDVESSFGYRRAFEKPDDLIRVVSVCSDEYFRSPLLQYYDEADFWWADVDTLYVRYVSDDNQYGMDFGKWPMSFARYVEAYLAEKVVMKITGGDEKKMVAVARALKEAKANALTKEAIAEPTKFPAPGLWVSARGGNRFNRDPSGGQLIG